MRPITPDACTIDLDVTKHQILLAAGNFNDLLESFDKTPLWCRPNQRIARMTGPKVLSPLPRRSQTANVGVPTHFSNHEAAASDRG
jgi:hypothetical protein